MKLTGFESDKINSEMVNHPYTSVIYKLLVYKNFCYMNDLATRQYYIYNKKVHFRQSHRRRNKGAV